ncbi:MAG: AAA family ATPase [Desulfobulbaceae bacterium]|nr:AAA family ATPase [Desulfobulbaceae bacterium]
MNHPSRWAAQFGLNKNPFQDTINTDLFFRTKQHEEAAVKIKIGIEDRHALILLDGVSGTGKTLATQVVLRSLDPDYFAPFFVPVFPGMGKGALLGAILTAMALDSGRLVHDRLAVIQEKALAYGREGRRLVIIIDEAHFLSADALHSLRTLSNLETGREKLVTVLLVAEPGLAKRLQSPFYASLRGRITFAVRLEPLTLDGLEQYVKYRILKCGGDPALLLPPESYPLIHELSHGIPRDVNRLLYVSFIEAMTVGQPVGLATIRVAADKRGALDG